MNTLKIANLTGLAVMLLGLLVLPTTVVYMDWKHNRKQPAIK